MSSFSNTNLRDIVKEKIVMLRNDGMLDGRDENECIDKTMDILDQDENFKSILETYITSVAMWA